MSAEGQSVAERLRWVIEALGLTQAEFAASAGVTPPQLSRWLNARPPSLRSLRAISARTGVSFPWLRSGEGKPFEAVEHVFADPATGWNPPAPGQAAPGGFDGGLRVRRLGEGPPAEDLEQRMGARMREHFASRLDELKVSAEDKEFFAGHPLEVPPPKTRLERRMEVARRALVMAGHLFDFGQWEDFSLWEDDSLELTREEAKGLKVGIRALLAISRRSLPGGNRTAFTVEEAATRRGALLDEMVDVSKVYKDVLAKVKPVLTAQTPSLDDLLDKVAESGLNSLTEEERTRVAAQGNGHDKQEVAE